MALTRTLCDEVSLNALADRHALSYMFLRYLKLLMRVFLVFTLLTFAVIIPVDTAGIITTNGAL